MSFEFTLDLNNLNPNEFTNLNKMFRGETLQSSTFGQDPSTASTSNAISQVDQKKSSETNKSTSDQGITPANNFSQTDQASAVNRNEPRNEQANRASERESLVSARTRQSATSNERTPFQENVRIMYEGRNILNLEANLRSSTQFVFNPQQMEYVRDTYIDYCTICQKRCERMHNEDVRPVRIQNKRSGAVF